MADEFAEISGSKLRATIVPYGARLADLRLEGHERPLVLRYENLADFQADKLFMGAVIGRYGNRVDGGIASIDGKTFQLEKNENGERHLHGGRHGFASRLWGVDDQGCGHVRLSFISADGDAGYPGNLRVSAEYSIVSGDVLRLDLRATTDQTTIVNLCHHPYFHFGGGPGLRSHKLQIHASDYLPSRENLVPTGEIAAVAGTPFDFRKSKSLTDPEGKPCQLFNNTYCLSRSPHQPLAHAATLNAADVDMELWTTQPGIHLYNGYKLDGSAIGFDREPLKAFAGVCLEAQNWPDSPNHPHFPDCHLRAGETYFQRTEYRFAPKAE